MSKRVVVTDYTFPDLAREEAAARSCGAEFFSYQCRSGDDVCAAVKDVDVAIVQFAPFTAAAVAAIKQGATLIRYGVGYDNIDIEAAKRRHLSLGYVPDYCTAEVADHTVAAALAMLRKLKVLDASVRSGEWAATRYARPLKPFSSTRFGFFGLGRIGRSVLERLRGFGFEFLVFDPALSDVQAAELGVRLVEVEALLRSADILSLHAPGTAALKGFFNAQRFSLMQPHSVIINAARGHLIVEDDLAAALCSGIIGGAALDVFVKEPLDVDSPLRNAPNLLLTPHVAWYSDTAIERLQSLVAEDIINALSGKPLRQPIPVT